MKKTCVFITGTNGVGKSALAQSIIAQFGGIEKIVNDVTYCKESKICFAGPYVIVKHGGVDRITNEQGNSCTSRLAEVVEEGLKHYDVIFCEGSFMNTFGLNMTNAMFKASKYLVVNLWLDIPTLYARLKARSDGKNGKRNFPKIAEKQKNSMIAARKWQSIGVKVLQLNTSEMTIDDEVKLILKTIQTL